MNKLSIYFPAVHGKLTDTDADCFYDDEKLPEFWKQLTNIEIYDGDDNR